MLVFKVRGRIAVALLFAGIWFEACGGEAFQATASGSAGHAGLAANGGGDAGSALGGDAQGAEAGASNGGEAGVPGAGMSSGGSEAGGTETGGAAQGGSTLGGTGGLALGGSGGVAAGGGVLGTTNSGDCKSDADCPNGKCIELALGGFRTCQVTVPLAAKCAVGDVCCPDDPTKACASGRCVLGPAAPSCGLVQAARNFCAVAQCTSNVACKDKNTCAPAGTLGRKEAMCLTGSCRVDLDCTAVKGGKCEPVTLPCCEGVSGLYCVYPSGCRSSADCKSGDTCQLSGDGKSMECKAGGVSCPG